jgi:hypothetical protein
MIAVFDHPDASFRSKLLPSYKAQRPPVPEELKQQFQMVRDAVKAYAIPAVEVPGYAAYVAYVSIRHHTSAYVLLFQTVPAVEVAGYDYFFKKKLST